MKTNVLLMAGIVTIGMMASCSNKDDVVQSRKAEPATINIAIKGSSLSTKAAADLSNDGQINRIAIGLFDADNNLVSITEPTFTIDEDKKLIAQVTGTTLVTKIAAVANAPAGAFASAKKLDDFHKVAIDISNTSADNTKQKASNLPMEGDGTVDGASTGIGSANFALTRLVSKIELNKITVDFDTNGAYAGYTFIPTEIFMSNVAETAYANAISPYVTHPTYLQGETGKNGAVTYLSTGSISLTVADSYSPACTFFPMANDGSLSGNSKTKLIIKGILYKSSTIDDANKVDTYYYPIIINHAMPGTTTKDSESKDVDYKANGIDGQIGPNTYYQLSATIKSKGVTDPTQDLTSAAVNLTITVAPWPTAFTQNVVFN